MKVRLSDLIKIPILSLLVLNNSCFMDAIYGKPKTVTIFPRVYNLSEINSPYDEYNAVAPTPPVNISAEFVFSTNFNSKGKQFDIWSGNFDFFQETVELGQPNKKPEISNKIGSAFLDKEGNTENNEYGPNFLFNMNESQELKQKVISEVQNDNSIPNDQKTLKTANVYTFSSDRKNGKTQDIYFYSKESDLQEFFGNLENSTEAYLTYDYSRNTLYFASDRDGNFDIYKYERKDGNENFKTWLGDKNLAKDIVKADEFNSEFNDNCPFIYGDHMVFVSDRPGGYGGYDIFYSRYTSEWYKPVNIQYYMDEFSTNYSSITNEGFITGSSGSINTASDEFRPSIYDNKPVTLIFSSNRPGGKGGFDLHLAILPERITDFSSVANFNRELKEQGRIK